jgi:hypothetical protein
MVDATQRSLLFWDVYVSAETKRASTQPKPCRMSSTIV